MTTFTGLASLLGGYFHQDWPEDYDRDGWRVVQDFATGEHDDAVLALTEIDQLLNSGLSEQDLREHVLKNLKSGYLVEVDGWTYKDWLSEVAKRIKQVITTWPNTKVIG